jgi:hypothetical protein
MRFGVLLVTLLKGLLAKVGELLDRPTDVHYTSTPVWKPWRDY